MRTALVLLLLSSTARAVTIDWTTVGNPGNAPDNQNGNLLGAVNYTYLMGKYEVTNSQYAEFLNTKDATGNNALGLYNANMSGIGSTGGISFTAANSIGAKYSVVPGRGNLPVNFVTWYSAIRFANWMDNSQGTGSTETGAYTLLGGTPIPSNGSTITRNPGALVFVPSEDEWYKAAYYNPATSAYFAYPAGSNTAPAATTPPGSPNSANYGLVVGDLTDVGSYSSSPNPYGTFDQGGNVEEWLDVLGSNVSSREGRGGGYVSPLQNLSSLNRDDLGPLSQTFSWVGFRVATVVVPEPTTFALAAIGLLIVSSQYFHRAQKIARLQRAVGELNGDCARRRRWKSRGVFDALTVTRLVG